MSEARERLAKLFGRLGCDCSAGERRNALVAIDKALVASGLSWAWVRELIADGVHGTDADAAARDGVLARLLSERLGEAMFGGANALATAEFAEVRRVHERLLEARSLRSLTTAEISRVLDLADQVRRRVGRR